MSDNRRDLPVPEDWHHHDQAIPRLADELCDAARRRGHRVQSAIGGIMFWELSEDTTDEHSLYKVIQEAM